jgi:hypothetical protein
MLRVIITIVWPAANSAVMATLVETRLKNVPPT